MSSRMGEDKALKPFLGRPLIQRVIDRVAPIADEIIVTTNHPRPQAWARRLGRTLHCDRICHFSAGGCGGLRYAFRWHNVYRRRAQAAR